MFGIPHWCVGKLVPSLRRPLLELREGGRKASNEGVDCESAEFIYGTKFWFAFAVCCFSIPVAHSLANLLKIIGSGVPVLVMSLGLVLFFYKASQMVLFGIEKFRLWSLGYSEESLFQAMSRAVYVCAYVASISISLLVILTWDGMSRYG